MAPQAHLTILRLRRQIGLYRGPLNANVRQQEIRKRESSRRMPVWWNSV
jgi:hypothetical protein